MVRLVDDIKAEEIPQAVILAETFNSKFQPLSDHVPFALLHLSGRPLLDYNLDLLYGNGFQEVFIFCHGRNSARIKEFVKNSKWSTSFSSRFMISVISADNYLSHGDMLRDLDGKNYIRSDFLFMQCGVISNMDLKEAMKEHRNNNVISNGQNLMTIVVRKMSPKHLTRSPDEHFVIVMSPSKKVLHAHFNEHHRKQITIPLTVLEQGRVSIRADLSQTKIVFCTQHVPAVFSDNFDFQDTNDFVKGIIEHEEIMQNCVHLHEVTDAYCASVTNMTLYNQISVDIAKRWVYPYTIDLYNRDCQMKHGSYYTSSRARIHPSAVIEPFSVILGEVKEGARVTRSFIGENCVVGARVTLNEVTLGQNVKIEDDCTLTKCYVADNCTIYSKSTLSAGCIIAPGVSIGPDIKLVQQRLQNCPCEDSFGDVVDSKPNSSKFGLKSLAYEFMDDASESDSDSDEEEVTIEEKYGQDSCHLSEGFCSQDEESEDESVEDEELDEVDRGNQVEGQEDIDCFFNEVLESLQRGVEENIKAENLILEINSCKHAYNITINEIIQLTVKAILTLCVGENGTNETFMATFKKATVQIVGILKNYVKKPDSQEIALTEIGNFYSELARNGADQSLMKTLQNILNFLYQKDILSEDVIIEWYEDLDDETLSKHLKAFIEWLQNDDDEDDDDD